MTTVLKIQASLFGAQGQSSQLADRFIQTLRDRHGALRVVTRDLNADPVPPLTLERFQALTTADSRLDDAQRAALRQSDALVAELQAADVVVFAVPMYNFTIPASLHNYFDHIARAGVTFRYTGHGPEGLLKGKRTYVFAARGGQHGGDGHSQTLFLRQFLGFIGLEDAKFVYAEGLAMGDQARAQGLDAARAQLEALSPAQTRTEAAAA